MSLADWIILVCLVLLQVVVIGGVKWDSLKRKLEKSKSRHPLHWSFPNPSLLDRSLFGLSRRESQSWFQWGQVPNLPPGSWSTGYYQQSQGPEKKEIRSLQKKEYLNHPIAGFRAFRLNVNGRRWDVMGHVMPEDFYLGPINQSFGAWFPGVNVAEHCGTGRFKGERYPSPHGNGPCPEKGEHCGFWMLHEFEATLDKVSWDPALTFYPVIGVVQGWGRVQEHEDGYRVQYASVVALAMYPYRTGIPITGPAYDFGCETLKRVCRQFDCEYVDDAYKLNQIKRKLDAENEKPKGPI